MHSIVAAPADGSATGASHLHLTADKLMHSTWDDEAGMMVNMDLATMIKEGAGKGVPITAENSGPCKMETAGTVRYHASYRRLEVCAMALRPDDYYWHPVGAPPGCWMAGPMDVCERCHRGLVLSGGSCLEVGARTVTGLFRISLAILKCQT